MVKFKLKGNYCKGNISFLLFYVFLVYVFSSKSYRFRTDVIKYIISLNFHCNKEAEQDRSVTAVLLSVTSQGLGTACDGFLTQTFPLEKC